MEQLLLALLLLSQRVQEAALGIETFTRMMSR
jgi:hypothetical protein